MIPFIWSRCHRMSSKSIKFTAFNFYYSFLGIRKIWERQKVKRYQMELNILKYYVQILQFPSFSYKVHSTTHFCLSTRTSDLSICTGLTASQESSWAANYQSLMDRTPGRRPRLTQVFSLNSVAAHLSWPWSQSQPVAWEQSPKATLSPQSSPGNTEHLSAPKAPPASNRCYLGSSRRASKIQKPRGKAGQKQSGIL